MKGAWRAAWVLAVVLATVLTVVGLVACAVPESAPRFRFIEVEPEALLERGAPYAEEEAFAWTLPGRTPRNGLAPNPPLFDRSVDFDAATVHAVEATIEDMLRGQVKLSWQVAGSHYDDVRQITLQAEHMPGDGSGEVGTRVFTFPVATVSAWRGRITGLRLYTGQRRRWEVGLVAVRGLRHRVDEESLAAVVDQPWKVNLGRDLRSALLAPPGQAITRRLTIPRHAALRFGYGLQPGVRVPVDFRVAALRRGRKPQPLFSARLTPEEAGWREGEVDLGALAGKEVELRLETASEGEHDLALGFPLWSHPEVVSTTQRDPRPNVVLVSIDTLRPDHLSLYGYDKLTSPRLDAWAGAKATVFRNAVAQAPATLASHTSLFTALDALRHNTSHHTAPHSLVTLAERLRDAGYATFARTGGGYLHPRYGLAQGFDTYRYFLAEHHRDEELEEGMALTLDWLDRNAEQPFFLFFHTYEVHGPYRPRQPYFGQLSPGLQAPEEGLIWLAAERPTAAEGFRATRRGVYLVRAADPSQAPVEESGVELAKALYDSSISYVDAHLGRLFDRLEALGVAEQTIVIITSDHGEAFGEHGLGGHGYLYDNNLLIPLVVALPGGAGAGRTIDQQVRSIDVVPTVLEAADLPVPAGIDGVSLLPLIEGRATSFPGEAWSYAANDNFGLALRVRNRLKYIYNNAVWSAVQGREELYRLDADPAEVAERVALDPQAAALRDRVIEHLADAGAGLLVAFANDSTETLSGAIEGKLVGPTRVKANAMPCDCITWEKRGVLRYTVPPGTAYTLRFEGDPGPRAVISGRLEGEKGAAAGPAFEEALVLGNLEGVHIVEVVDGAFARRNATTAAVATGIAVYWHGRNASASSPLFETEPELMRQLQALGYVH